MVVMVPVGILAGEVLDMAVVRAELVPGLEARDIVALDVDCVPGIFVWKTYFSGWTEI